VSVLNGDDRDRCRLSSPFAGPPPRFASSPSRPRPPRFRMGFELPYVVFSPRNASGSLLFRHGFYSSLERIVAAIIAAVLSDAIEVDDLSNRYHTSDGRRANSQDHPHRHGAFYASVEQRDDPSLRGKNRRAEQEADAHRLAKVGGQYAANLSAYPRTVRNPGNVVPHPAFDAWEVARDAPARSHSSSFDQRRRPETL
jgi:hypothetical protein